MAESPVPEQLLALREQIDEVDRRLVLLLAERFALTSQVGQLKADTRLEAVDPEREAQKLEVLQKLSRDNGINPELVAGLFRKIMAEAVENHRRIRQAERG